MILTDLTPLGPFPPLVHFFGHFGSLPSCLPHLPPLFLPLPTCLIPCSLLSAPWEGGGKQGDEPWLVIGIQDAGGGVRLFPLRVQGGSLVVMAGADEAAMVGLEVCVLALLARHCFLCYTICLHSLGETGVDVGTVQEELTALVRMEGGKLIV